MSTKKKLLESTDDQLSNTRQEADSLVQSKADRLREIRKDLKSYESLSIALEAEIIALSMCIDEIDCEFERRGLLENYG